MCGKIEIPLDIEDIDVKNVSFTENNEILITVDSTVEGTPCHCCGKLTQKYHGRDRELKLRHLSILGKKTYLCIKPRRYLCEECKNRPTTTQKLPWYDERCSYTKAYEKHILLMLINSTLTDVSHKEEMAYDTVEGLLDRFIGQEVDWNEIKALKTIGIDEIALKKGHRDFVAIVTSLGDKGQIRLLGVLKNREQTTVKEFFISIPNNLRETIENICTDLHDGYINAAREVFGENITIIADRFHVARLYRKSVDTLRTSEMKRLKEELSDGDYQQLHNLTWTIRKKPEELSDENKATLKKLNEWSPKLIVAYLFSNQLTDIFEKPLTPSEAKAEITAWARLVRDNHLDCFDTFLGTLEKYMKPITHYFDARLSSGFVEGLNNKIKVIKRRCYGICNPIHLFQRISLDLVGYERFILKSMG